MTSPDTPRKPKRLAYIVRADVFPQGLPDDLLNDETYAYGPAWAAVESLDSGPLIAVGADIAAVTQAARFAGFWIADQSPEGTVY